MRRVAVLGLVLVGCVACAGGTSDAERGHEQAVAACTSARDGGASSTMAIVHAHQAAGLDKQWQPLANSFGQVGVLRQSLGADLGAGEDDTTGATALAAVAATCQTLGVTVPTTAQATSPLDNLNP